MRSHLFICALLAPLALLAIGCKKKEPDSSQKSVDVDDVKKTMKSDLLPKVQAKVPKDLEKKLDFEVGMAADDRVVAVVPSGWKLSVIKAFEPDDDSFGTKVWISSNCDGMCTAKDWEKVADKVDVAGMKTSTAELVSDDKLDDGRVVVMKDKSGSGDDEVRMVVLRWKKDASRYFACRVELQGAWVPAQQAFLDACKGMQVVRWGN